MSYIGADLFTRLQSQISMEIPEDTGCSLRGTCGRVGSPNGSTPQRFITSEVVGGKFQKSSSECSEGGSCRISTKVRSSRSVQFRYAVVLSCCLTKRVRRLAYANRGIDR